MRCPTLAELPPPPEGKTGWPWTEESPRLPIRTPDGREWPKISIVTPSYNQGQFIEETIRSVLLQGYPNIEYIIIDGGSIDATVSVLKQYDKYVHWISEDDEGQADAIAKGFEKATGEILAWINSDDRYLSSAIHRISNYFQRNPDCIFVNGNVNIINKDSEFQYTVYAVRPNGFLTANAGLHGWPQQGCFWRREAYYKVGGIDRTLQFCMDRDLFIRLVGIGKANRIGGKPIAEFRIHEEAKTSTWIDVFQREDKLLKEKYGKPYFHEHPFLPKLCWWVWIGPRWLNIAGQRITMQIASRNSRT